MLRAYEICSMKKAEKCSAVHLEWDTSYFGVTCAKVVIGAGLTPGALGLLYDAIRSHKFTAVFNEGGDWRVSEIVYAIPGSRLTDAPVQLRRPVTNEAFDGTITISDKLPTEEGMLEIAGSSFLKGRFYKDPNISEAQASGLYASWVRGAFYSPGRYFIVPADGSGFALVSDMEDGKGLDIELIAVSKNRRGQGIGSAIIKRINGFAHSRGRSYLNVVTQTENYPALRLYAGNGFVYVKTSYVFHIWS